MEKFIHKYGHAGDAPEPWKAIELICDMLYNIKEKVERGENDLKGLSELSMMIDDYVKESQGHQFKPKHYHDLQGEHKQGHPHDYNPYTTVGRIGYRQYPQDWFYPMYPFYNDRGYGYYPQDRGNR